MFLPIQEQRLQLERRTQIFEGIVKRTRNAVNLQIYDKSICVQVRRDVNVVLPRAVVSLILRCWGLCLRPLIAFLTRFLPVSVYGLKEAYILKRKKESFIFLLENLCTFHSANLKFTVLI